MIPQEAGWASEYIGIPYEDRGRDKATGVDCWGLVKVVAKEQFGLELPAYDDKYATANSVDEVAKHVKKVVPEEWEKITRANWKIGDVILMQLFSRSSGLSEPCHVGIWLGNGYILHVHVGINTCVENIDRPGFPGRIAGGYRYAG